ncbi:hypothetical protein [Zavarzinella formosa]|uniref:hypothetical protein n=1 Tax=Zavarzinella formosa TaxID=360055 RepID=UPI0012FBFF8F|nr:hypothetical protein [Zavarzinella formosa]
MLAMAKKPQKTPKRSGVPIQTYVGEDTRAALDQFIEAQRLKPSLTEVVEVAIQDFLIKEGFWPLKPKADSDKK